MNIAYIIKFSHPMMIRITEKHFHLSSMNSFMLIGRSLQNSDNTNEIINIAMKQTIGWHSMVFYSLFHQKSIPKTYIYHKKEKILLRNR